MPDPGAVPPALVSVVLSFRNEAESIPELIDRLTRAFAPVPVAYELIFVNDASTDASLNLLTAAAAREPRIKIVTMSRRFGPSECAIAGLTFAKGAAVILMDTDLQDPPELIPQLIHEWQAGADVVYTVRTVRRAESLVKRFMTRAAYRIVRAVAAIDLPVEAGDFRLLSRRVVDELLKLPERSPYLRGLVSWVGFTQVPVYYERAPRFAGRTHFPLLLSANPWRTFLAGLTSFSMTPLVILLPLGLGIGAVSLGASALLLMVGAWRQSVPAWAWGALGLSFLAGLQLAGLGLIGVYVGRIAEDVRGRPRYIVDSVAGFDE